MKISLRKIGKSYSRNFAINNFDLEIPEHCFLTLLGPSGCGKTTILRMIAGLEIPDQGEIWFGDKCVFSANNNIFVPPEARNMGFVFQDFALWPHLTVFENVAFGLRMKKQTTDLAKNVEVALESVKLTNFQERYPHQLSGGQQQRVAFARAIAAKPACILFDEPLSALDAILREEMQTEIKLLVQELKINAIFVTHDQREAMSMSDSIAVINNGVIEQMAAPETLYNRPKTLFTAKFVGSSNWLNSTEMFRPESARLAPVNNALKFVARVKASKYQGSFYELNLQMNEQCWKVYSSEQRQIGDLLQIYVQENNIISVQDMEAV
ncbi:MAG TPA: ABC transporter ATP-binding protein [Candidatus Avacidaminococcus intestinavium]|uniref:ABC-type quaternary amine transporter n=1 Tax=Candidatus Avacidaminococcus intestinavium TaxID=2840684 RepID=A0A9D1MPU3_9FIRM|nr:ABC transporter ATP-binding protein [Candidatus Avacidaminococcus intestinavium]